jgi:hypothetical protein
MTPTPPQKREEAAQGVFAGPLDQKSWRESNARLMECHRAVRNFARPMFRPSVARLIVNLMRMCSANWNEGGYEAAQSAAQKRKGRLTSNFH